MWRKKSAVSPEKSVEQIVSIKYSAKRRNIPSAGLEAHERIEEAPDFALGAY
jgi:hypothetical protein